MFLFTSAFGSILGIGVSAVAYDPKYVWFYTGLGVACVISTVLFWYVPPPPSFSLSVCGYVYVLTNGVCVCDVGYYILHSTRQKSK